MVRESIDCLPTIKADLFLTNCTLKNGVAIGGNGGGGGLGAGGGVYIDRGNKLILINTSILNCQSKGGIGTSERRGGGGASFSSNEKNAIELSGGGDYPGTATSGGSFDNSEYLNGYGGGDGGKTKDGSRVSKSLGKGAGKNAEGVSGGDGGYCGGGGSGSYFEFPAGGGRWKWRRRQS